MGFTAPEPPPYGVIDLGNGEVLVQQGDAADFRTAAEWLERNYPGEPEHKIGPVTGRLLNMTNYGSLAILALDLKRRGKVASPGEANLRWLIALETFPADTNGWRQVGGELLAELAGVSPRTSRRVRDRLVTEGLLEYRRGNGRGQRSSYRFTFPIKVDTQADHLSVDNHGAKGGHLGDEKVATWPDKGGQQNPLTSANATHALEAFGLGTSALEASEISADPEPRRARNEAPASLDEYLDRFRRQHRGNLTRET